MKLSMQHLQQAHRDGAANFADIFKQVTRTVLEQIETLSRITSEFSQFARMPRRAIERCSVHALLSDAMSLYNQHRNVRWKSNLAAPVDTVNVDPEELRRAFVNILRNSLQAIEQKGTIEIQTSAGPNSIVISFVDDGPGVAPEVEAKLFTPNFSTKTDGMGLGLTIVKKTIEDAGGSITIGNIAGKGAGVTVRLPLADRSAGA
jgi:nitrogen fixation/metabolism regulation signal transduction histidine kinase